MTITVYRNNAVNAALAGSAVKLNKNVSVHGNAPTVTVGF